MQNRKENEIYLQGEGQWNVLIHLMSYLWPKNRTDLKIRVVLAIIALILAKITTVITPFTLKWTVDILTDQSKQMHIAGLIVAGPITLLIAYGAGRIMMILWAQIRDALFAKVGQFAVRTLALKTFKHLHQLSLRFHLERRTGGLSRIVERGTKGIEIVIRYALFNIIPTLLEIILVYGIIIAIFGTKYAIVTFIVVCAYIWFTYTVTEWRIGIRRKMNDADTKANTKAVDSLLNFETVKYFTNEKHEARRFDRSMEQYEDAATKTMTSLSLLNSGQAVIFSLGFTICLIFAAQAISQNTLTVGDFVLLNALFVQLYMPLNFLGTMYRDIKQGLIDTESIFLLLDVNAEIKDDENAQKLTVNHGGEITFNNVSFHYDEQRPILKNISFTVKAGKKIAIVGPSGAGKSTISRLIYRFYDTTAGEILIDGQNIKHVTQTSLRETIGMVPQDTVLFNDTLEYNILYGKPKENQNAMIHAAKLAQINQFVQNLPDKYQTMVGERGLKLSGGEKQRVAIARTILKNPPILILDEATSALDTHTEREIQTALNTVAENRTTLVIAHRLSTIVDADEIIVLDKGKIVERGNHNQLMKKNKLYANMWSKQREADEARHKIEQDQRGPTAEQEAINI